MNRWLPVLLAGGLLLVLPTLAPAAPADVRVRVEGTDVTLLERAAVRTTNTPVNKDAIAGRECTGTSAAGALDVAVAGDWSGSFFAGLGYTVERVRGERHTFPEPDFFEVWVNNRSLAVGVCGIELQDGDDMLLFVARCESGPPPDFACLNEAVLPLGLSAPATVTPGAPFSATVVEYAKDGAAKPVAGATVSGGDAPATTNAAGVATVTIATAGTRTLEATRAGRARSANEPVCATSGSDGRCGSAVVVLDDRCRSNGSDGRCATRDRTAPAAAIRGIAEGQRFARGRGPRELRAVVEADPSGLRDVKLRLTRTDRGRCSTFSGKSERLRRVGCGARNGFWFSVGDRQDTSYLLPGRLPRGRYVLDVNAIDKAYNRDDARRRGGNRVVFHVR